MVKGTEAEAVFEELVRGEAGNQISERDDKGRFAIPSFDNGMEPSPDTIPLSPDVPRPKRLR